MLVAIRDSGPGIDPTHLDRVFEAFYTTKSSGMGMGLSICRCIIHAHGVGFAWKQTSLEAQYFISPCPTLTESSRILSKRVDGRESRGKTSREMLFIHRLTQEREVNQVETAIGQRRNCRVRAIRYSCPDAAAVSRGGSPAPSLPRFAMALVTTRTIYLNEREMNTKECGVGSAGEAYFRFFTSRMKFVTNRC